MLYTTVMRWSRISYPVIFVILSAAYFGFAHLGLNIHAVNRFATLVWIPSGLALAFLVRFGLRFWPAVAVAALLANYLNGAAILSAIGISVGNTLEPVVGAYLLRRVVKFHPEIEDLKDVFGLVVLAAILSTAISATIGVTTLLANGQIENTDYGVTWLSWWWGDAISILIIAPLLLVWSKPIRGKIPVRQVAEAIGFMAITVLTAVFIYSSIGYELGDGRPITYLVFPPLMWVALRYGMRASVTVVFAIGCVAVWQTIHGWGPFVKDDPSINLLFAQINTGVAALMGMTIAATVSEQKIHERKKDEFISVASHELKTPLTSIKAFTQTLQVVFEKKGDRESFAHMSRVNRQVDRLNRLVVKLLDLSRIQEGRIVLQKERFVIGSLVREIADEVAATTHHKIVIQGDTGTSVFADRDRIGRVLTNLLSNAAAYSPDAKRIVIKVTKRSPNLIIRVQDFGVGIHKEDQDHLFDRFYQVKSKTADSGVSLGLGLYIANTIIERHGGKIWVKSSANQKKYPGSTFFFTLPLKPN